MTPMCLDCREVWRSQAACGLEGCFFSRHTASVIIDPRDQRRWETQVSTLYQFSIGGLGCCDPSMRTLHFRLQSLVPVPPREDINSALEQIKARLDAVRRTCRYLPNSSIACRKPALCRDKAAQECCRPPSRSHLAYSSRQTERRN